MFQLKQLLMKVAGFDIVYKARPFLLLIASGVFLQAGQELGSRGGGAGEDEAEALLLGGGANAVSLMKGFHGLGRQEDMAATRQLSVSCLRGFPFDGYLQLNNLVYIVKGLTFDAVPEPERKSVLGVNAGLSVQVLGKGFENQGCFLLKRL